jgi:hypothetical protein
VPQGIGRVQAKVLQEKKKRKKERKKNIGVQRKSRMSFGW